SSMAPRDPRSPSNAAAPAAARPSSVASAPVVDAGWLTVFREGQQQTAEAHAAFQRAMADAHQAFLRAFEVSTEQLSQIVSGGVVTMSAPIVTASAESAPAFPARLSAAPTVSAAPVPALSPAPAPAAPVVSAPVAPAPAVIARP